MGSQMLDEDGPRPGEGRVAGCLMAILVFGSLIALIAWVSWGCFGPH